MKKYTGFLFVVLLFISAATVSLPNDDASQNKLASFYGKQAGIIVAMQILGIIAAILLVFFAQLIRKYKDNEVANATIAVAIAGTLPVYPIIAMSLLAKSTSNLTVLNHISTQADNILFLVITIFSLVVYRNYSRGLKYIAALVTFLSLARAALGFVGNESLNAIAPITFLVLVVCLNANYLRSLRRK